MFLTLVVYYPIKLFVAIKCSLYTEIVLLIDNSMGQVFCKSKRLTFACIFSYFVRWPFREHYNSHRNSHQGEGGIIYTI